MKILYIAMITYIAMIAIDTIIASVAFVALYAIIAMVIFRPKKDVRVTFIRFITKSVNEVDVNRICDEQIGCCWNRLV